MDSNKYPHRRKKKFNLSEKLILQGNFSERGKKDPIDSQERKKARDCKPKYLQYIRLS